MKRKNCAAFTLIELLIATVIFSLVILSLYSAFQVGLSSYRRLDYTCNTFQTARLLFNRLELDLKNALIYNSDNSMFRGSASGLDFISSIDSYDKDNINTDICRVRYDFNDTTLKRRCLYAMQALSDGFELAADELSNDVKRISFSYAFATGNPDTPYEWQEYWPKQGEEAQEAGLPLAVKIKLSLIEKDINKNESGVIDFSRIIPLPLGGMDSSEK